MVLHLSTDDLTLWLEKWAGYPAGACGKRCCLLDVKMVPLTRGMFAFVDECDYQNITYFKWYANKKNNGYYAACRYHDEHMYLHRLIMALAGELHHPFSVDHMVVDHKNRNTLNCRRSNLRVVTVAENNRNRKSWGKKNV